MNKNTTIFKFLFINLILIFISNITKAQTFQYLSTFNSQGVPSQLLFDTVPVAIMNNITTNLPESKPVPTYHPEYIASGVTTDLKITGNTGDSANVWITFLTEGAGYKSVLGFYSYDLNSPPTSAPANSGITIIFPNVSFYNSGGGLHTGDKVWIGKFPMNTGIGFVVLANGFTSSGTVTQGAWRLFSNPSFNPESNVNLRNHIVLLNDTVYNKIIFSFEDIRRDNGSCDNDFNDVVFYISADPMSSLSVDGITYAQQSPLNPPVSSGNNGGLESNGTLAEILSYRNFKKSMNPSVFNDYYAANKTSSNLVNYLPELNNQYLKQDVTPLDLKGVTNAEEIVAYDYFSEKTRVASIFSTLTNNSVYDHSKVICDRLNGAELLNVETILLYDHTFILYHFKNAQGFYEYAISFSIANDAQNTVYSRWVTEQYPTGFDYKNFQIWGQSRVICEQLAAEILTKLNTEKSLSFDQNAANFIPNIFVSKGNYVRGKLLLTIMNKENANQILMSGVVRKSETLTPFSWTNTIETKAQTFLEKTVEIDPLFDVSLKLKSNDATAADVLYLADGAWGLDYVKGSQNIINHYETTPQIINNSTDFALERGIQLDAQTSDYIAAFKLLKPSAKPTDLTAYNALEFDAKNTTSEVKITLVKESITDNSKQFSTNLSISNDKTHYAIFFADFSNLTSEKIDAKDITSVVITTAANGDSKPVKWDLSNFTFTKNGKETKSYLGNKVFDIAPNPCTSNTMVYFKAEKQGTVKVTLTNSFGQIVKQEISNVNLGQNAINILTQDLQPGVYLITITDDNSFYYSSKLNKLN